MRKIIIITATAIALITLGIGVFFYINNSQSPEQAVNLPAEQTDATAQPTGEQTSQIALPSIQTNPLENKPDINPAGKANPIKNIKTNPFE